MLVPFYIFETGINYKYDLLDLNHILSKEFGWELDSFDLVEIKFKDNKTRFALNPPTDLSEQTIDNLRSNIEKLIN
jgi:hypothetical protein